MTVGPDRTGVYMFQKKGRDSACRVVVSKGILTDPEV